jgi:hypothetical protein
VRLCQGAPVIDHHDYVFSGKRWRVTILKVLVNFHASGEGHRGHETLHQAAAPELVLDGVAVVQASHFKERLKMVGGRTRLVHAGDHNLGDVFYARAICSLVDAAVVISCGLLAILFAPLPTAIGTLLRILGGDIE